MIEALKTFATVLLAGVLFVIEHPVAAFVTLLVAGLTFLLFAGALVAILEAAGITLSFL
ncbi:hypothetical protein OPIT5_03730 [Opitutaceae bacterium TAV5]|nr:hypothetical protein OPIT5_03730 [Opitutaceae bacterium TAV5]